MSSELALIPDESNSNSIKTVNVSQVKQISPFRYPGGKTWFVPYFLSHLNSIDMKFERLIEPFVGGGIISLSLVHLKLVPHAIMIEKDEEVAAVWQTIFYGNCDYLVNRILTFELTPEKAIEVLSSDNNMLEERAFRTILKNRTRHGGIIAGGSGFLKRGEGGKGISSRWYPETICKRIRIIREMKDCITFHQGDGFEFINKYQDDDSAIFFVDPPYTSSKKRAGSRLYKYSVIDHEQLALSLSCVKGSVVITYDFDEDIVNLMESCGFRCEKIPMRGTHNSIRYELMITNNI